MVVQILPLSLMLFVPDIHEIVISLFQSVCGANKTHLLPNDPHFLRILVDERKRGFDHRLSRFTAGPEFPFSYNRLHPSDIPPDVAHSHGILELVGGMLKPEIKQFLCGLI
jgi:hypothetical protein